MWDDEQKTFIFNFSGHERGGIPWLGQPGRIFYLSDFQLLLYIYLANFFMWCFNAEFTLLCVLNSTYIFCTGEVEAKFSGYKICTSSMDDDILKHL
jgi:hypothetical protein